MTSTKIEWAPAVSSYVSMPASYDADAITADDVLHDDRLALVGSDVVLLTTTKGDHVGTIAEVCRWQAEHQGAMPTVEACGVSVSLDDEALGVAWWAWHDADSSRTCPAQEEAEEACAAWVADSSEFGPSIDAAVRWLVGQELDGRVVTAYHVTAEDSDAGDLLSVDASTGDAWVAWDSGTRTPADILSLRAE